MAQVQGIYPLRGVVQHYSWGGYSFIPELLGRANEKQEPWAEYWLGAHPNLPAQVMVHDAPVPLNQLIERYPEAVLGDALQQRFGRLPYLLKVLDVRQMLSIQVHPSKASAEEGYAREHQQGIAANAPHRNYKDDNHKPELMIALSDFWLLHGFKPEAHLVEVLETIPEFGFMIDTFREGGYKQLYQQVMTLPQEEVNQLLQPLIERILPVYHNGELLQQQEDFWAARAAETFCRENYYDRGIFSIYLFNLVHLKKGEGVYQQAGLPHAYLKGQNVELMANSDNVLRAGLTDKHIDVPELLKHVRFEATVPVILGAHAEVQEEIEFAVPVPEFALIQYRLEESSASFTAAGAEIVLVTEGSVTLQSNGVELILNKGLAALVCAGTNCTLQPLSPAYVFRAAAGKIETLGEAVS